MTTRDDFRVIRNALIALVLALITAVSLSGVSSYYYASAYRDNQRAQTEFKRMSERYLNVDREALIIEQRYPRFQALFNAGVLGAEDRLSWVESLKAAGKELGMDRLDYRVDPRKTYDGPLKLKAAPFEIAMSRMHITATLLHEGDLPRLLERIAATARGFMLPRECELQREGGTQVVATGVLGPSALGVRVSMVCELDWITIDWPGDKEITL